MTLDVLIQNVSKLKNMDALMGGVIKKHGGDIMELQRIQLLEGKDSNNNDLHPFYSEDLKPSGWFKSKESAGRYAAWKGTLNYPFTVKRSPDAPNLYINGKFHSELAVKFFDFGLSIVPATPYASRIVAKYGINSFGLSMVKWNVLFRERGVKDEIIRKVKDTIYGN